jgi:hypothetical protein
MRLWLSYAFVAAVQVAKCCTRVAWVRPGDCCLAGHHHGGDEKGVRLVPHPREQREVGRSATLLHSVTGSRVWILAVWSSLSLRNATVRLRSR